MTLFELVRAALDELYTEGSAVYGDKLDEEIKKRISYLADSYAQLRKSDRALVDYSDPATRFAYVYKYVATHGDYVVQLLSLARQALGGRVFNSETARLTCVGGGPGSDILATLKYLSDYGKFEPVKKVVCYLLDREQAWADTWTELDERLKASVAVNANFQPLDVTRPSSWRSQQKFLQADLFTMSYFVSEVMSLDQDGVVTSFWHQLFEGAKPGALFLYDDNGHDSFNSYFDRICKQAGLELLGGETNVRWTPRYSEQTSDLGPYLDKFGQQPKVQSYLTWRILRKPKA
jgi:ribosomal protein RSM22 (predicted rRNA methylase)